VPTVSKPAIRPITRLMFCGDRANETSDLSTTPPDVTRLSPVVSV
jgi:hypothetical protein